MKHGILGCLGILATALPRQKCRGLIEALLIAIITRDSRLLFPGRNAGASLKQESARLGYRERRASSPAEMPGPH